jgi:hypothetical protein
VTRAAVEVQLKTAVRALVRHMVAKEAPDSTLTLAKLSRPQLSTTRKKLHTQALAGEAESKESFLEVREVALFG